ncbi:hypothetical protein NM688_g7793 [Phlebia brevispora]|uniref:Uncharacterized protein n=1 Tax=Phlebia brevispora TaxID=194682 RepID=A0ACC1S166_9APHY|nr:hypothetical protein NM688_g7793 [Phlebia brevispora]
MLPNHPARSFPKSSPAWTPTPSQPYYTPSFHELLHMFSDVLVKENVEVPIEFLKMASRASCDDDDDDDDGEECEEAYSDEDDEGIMFAVFYSLGLTSSLVDETEDQNYKDGEATLNEEDQELDDAAEAGEVDFVLVDADITHADPRVEEGVEHDVQSMTLNNTECESEEWDIDQFDRRIQDASYPAGAMLTHASQYLPILSDASKDLVGSLSMNDMGPVLPQAERTVVSQSAGSQSIADSKVVDNALQLTSYDPTDGASYSYVERLAGSESGSNDGSRRAIDSSETGCLSWEHTTTSMNGVTEPGIGVETYWSPELLSAVQTGSTSFSSPMANQIFPPSAWSFTHAGYRIMDPHVSSNNPTIGINECIPYTVPIGDASGSISESSGAACDIPDPADTFTGSTHHSTSPIVDTTAVDASPDPTDNFEGDVDDSVEAAAPSERLRGLHEPVHVRRGKFYRSKMEQPLGQPSPSLLPPLSLPPLGSILVTSMRERLGVRGSNSCGYVSKTFAIRPDAPSLLSL